MNSHLQTSQLRLKQCNRLLPMRSASRWFGEDLAQYLKNFAVILGRLTGFHFFLRVADQRAQALRIGLRMSGEQLGQRAVVFHQTVAPAFQLVHIRDVML